ncbi:hypothetical protein CLU79DRAFT_554774 [Phycomyces nitens]|nr:hypothetical protein CLU79DRAFT_554774 [Phycomyces nitens]
MKIWSAIFLTAFAFQCKVLASSSDAHNISFSFFIRTDGFSKEDPLPCNGFPEERDIPANYFFFLGAHIEGLNSQAKLNQQTTDQVILSKNPSVTQDRTVTEMLDDGIRLLEVSLCKGANGKAFLCSGADKEADLQNREPFRDFTDGLFDFIQTRPKQVIVIHISSAFENQVSVKDIEGAIDEVCKVHAERTEGTDLFKEGECPFIYVQKDAKRIWPTMGELVNYDPEMAQWEGDGVDVGVKGMLIFTNSDNVITPEGYTSSYFSEVFWKSSHVPGQDPQEIQDRLHYMCKKTGGISLKAYPEATSTDYASANEKLYEPRVLEDLIASPGGCDLNKAPMHTYFNSIVVDFYQTHLAYLKDLQSRMVAINFAKWDNVAKPFTPSKLIPEQEKPVKHERDEL